MTALLNYVKSSIALLAAVKVAVDSGTASPALIDLYTEAMSKPNVFARGHVAQGLCHLNESDVSPAIWQAHAAVVESSTTIDEVTNAHSDS